MMQMLELSKHIKNNKKPHHVTPEHTHTHSAVALFHLDTQVTALLPALSFFLSLYILLSFSLGLCLSFNCSCFLLNLVWIWLFVLYAWSPASVLEERKKKEKPKAPEPLWPFWSPLFVHRIAVSKKNERWK